MSDAIISVISAVIASGLTYGGVRFASSRTRESDRETAANSRDAELSDTALEIIRELRGQITEISADLVALRAQVRTLSTRDLAWITRDSVQTHHIVTLGGSPEPLPDALK